MEGIAMRYVIGMLALAVAFVVMEGTAVGQTYSGTITGENDGDTVLNVPTPIDDVDIQHTTASGASFNTYVWVKKKRGSQQKWKREICIEPGDTGNTNDHDDVTQVDIGGPDYDPVNNPVTSDPGTAGYSGNIT